MVPLHFGEVIPLGSRNQNNFYIC